MKVYMVMVKSVERDWGALQYINPEAVCVGVYDSLEAAERTEAEFRVFLERVRESGELHDAWVFIDEKELNKTESVVGWLSYVIGEETAAEFMEGEQA